MSVTVCNRQRLLRVDVRLLREIAEELTDRSLTIVLVTDRAIARFNQQFHHIVGPTDILTFDYGEGEAELIISVERTVAQSRRYRTTPGRELALYVVHGTLHLAGYNDRTAAQRRRMRCAERRMLARLRRRVKLNRLVRVDRPRRDDYDARQ